VKVALYRGLAVCTIWESTAIISLENFNQFLFVMENQYLFCDVELLYLDIIGTNFMF